MNKRVAPGEKEMTEERRNLIASIFNLAFNLAFAVLFVWASFKHFEQIIVLLLWGIVIQLVGIKLHLRKLK